MIYFVNSIGIFAAPTVIGDFVEHDLDYEDEYWFEEFNLDRTFILFEK